MDPEENIFHGIALTDHIRKFSVHIHFFPKINIFSLELIFKILDFFVSLPDLLFRPFALRDIYINPAIAHQITCLVQHRNPAGLQMHNLSVFAYIWIRQSPEWLLSPEHLEGLCF